jgi:hypothetical protein
MWRVVQSSSVCAKWARGHWEVVGTSVPVGGRDSTTSIELHMVRAARTALPGEPPTRMRRLRIACDSGTIYIRTPTE